jgi:ABC-type transport system involved in multi-copper enzyme maturation permease subunit
LIVGSLLLAEMSLDNDVRVIRDFSFFISGLFSVVIGVYTSVTLLHAEFEDRTIYNILSKPVRRWEFVIGKVVGLELLLAGIIGFLAISSWGVLTYYGAAITTSMIWAYVMVIGQVSIVISVAVFLSTFASPLLSGVFAFVVFVAGNFHGQLQQMQEYLLEQGNHLLAGVLSLLRILLPDLEALNLAEEVTYSVHIPLDYIVSALCYSGSYTAVVLILAVAAFHFREIE